MRGALLLVMVGCGQASPMFVGSTVLRDTSDATGPYGVTTVIHSGSAVKRVEVFWDRDDGQFSTVNLVRVNGDDHEGGWSGTLPGLGHDGKLRYFFLAHTQDGPAASDPGSVGGQQAFYSFRVVDCPPDQRYDPETFQCVPR